MSPTSSTPGTHSLVCYNSKTPADKRDDYRNNQYSTDDPELQFKTFATLDVTVESKYLGTISTLKRNTLGGTAVINPVVRDSDVSAVIG